MDKYCIEIQSRLYPYSVEFISDFRNIIKQSIIDHVYVIDENVYRLYESCFSQIPQEHIYFMDATEQNKNMDTVMNIIRFWKSVSVKKNWKVVCVGGGITQDVTTIAANLFLRNVDWVFIPTTLLSMCDSCIGGKCGINLDQYKNQIGVFYPPQKIYIDTHFLETLTDEDYLNGWGELLKFSLTSDPAYYSLIKSENRYIPCDHISDYIYKGLMVKKAIIEADEFESDLRRILNYGHTFGHALECYTLYGVPHGMGVIWGIDIANYLAWKENLIPKSIYLDIKDTIRRCFLKDEISISKPEILFSFLKSDKKVKANTVFFALPDGESHLCIHPMEINNNLYDLFVQYLLETHEYYHN